MEMSSFVKVAPKKNAPRDDGMKKRKQTSSHTERAIGSNPDGCEKEVVQVKASNGGGLKPGKSHFYCEAVRFES